MGISFPPWFGLPVYLAIVAIAWIVRSHASSFAAAGAIVAVLGVLTIGRPIIRLGYAAWLKSSHSIDGGFFTPEETPPAFKHEEDQQALDGKAVQIWGPLLVGAGTLLNGFSGFIP